MFKTTMMLVATVCLLAAQADAGTIANWKAFSSTGTNSGLSTDSPTFGDASTADDGVGKFAGRFGTTGSPETVTLAAGETLTVTGSVTLTGGNDGPSIRFALLNDGGQFALDDNTNWTSGYLHKTATTGESDAGLYQSRTNGDFMSTGGDASQLVSVFDTASGSWDTDSSAAFDFSFAITRDSATMLSMVLTVSGGDGGRVETLSGTFTPPSADYFTYTVFGWQNSGSTDITRADFSGVEYNVTSSVIPTPAALPAGLLALAMVAARRRRR